MKNITANFFPIFLIIGSLQLYAQDSSDNEKSNIQTFTPSKLLDKRQWDIKFFNNLYTETEDLFGTNGSKRTILRQSFFTSTIDAFVGVSNTNRLNNWCTIRI